MKTNTLLFSLIALILFLWCSLSANAQEKSYDYSVKNRWTIKTSIARYKTAFWGNTFLSVGDNIFDQKNRKMVNFKVEANYGINKFIEIGIFTGFQHYEWIGDTLIGMNKSLAPLFGINANFHILPFFVKSKNCRWDLYLTAKYGGCYLLHKEIDHPDFPLGKYRHEYGLGLGLSYYFKNIIGLFAEGSVGQYFLFTRSIKTGYFIGNSLVFIDDTDSNFSFRIGIAAKL